MKVKINSPFDDRKSEPGMVNIKKVTVESYFPVLEENLYIKWWEKIPLLFKKLKEIIVRDSEYEYYIYYKEMFGRVFIIKYNSNHHKNPEWGCKHYV